jgi:hypothetical protein
MVLFNTCSRSKTPEATTEEGQGKAQEGCKEENQAQQHTKQLEA